MGLNPNDIGIINKGMTEFPSSRFSGISQPATQMMAVAQTMTGATPSKLRVSDPRHTTGSKPQKPTL